MRPYRILDIDPDAFDFDPRLGRLLGVRPAVLLCFFISSAESFDDELTFTAEELKKRTGISGDVALKTAREKLIEHGLITERLGGMPARLYWRLNRDAVRSAIGAV